MMAFARFATWYSVSLAVLGVAFSFLVAPCLGVHWLYWLTAGFLHISVVTLLVCARVYKLAIVIIHANLDGAPVEHSVAQRALAIVFPLWALLATLSLLVLTQFPVDSWSLAGYLAWFTAVGVLTPLIMDDDVDKVSATRFDSISVTPCDVSKCTERSVYVMAIKAGNENNVAFDLCRRHHTEFGCERERGTLDTYDDVMAWVRNEASRSTDTGAKRT